MCTDTKFNLISHARVHARALLVTQKGKTAEATSKRFSRHQTKLSDRDSIL